MFLKVPAMLVAAALCWPSSARADEQRPDRTFLYAEDLELGAGHDQGPSAAAAALAFTDITVVERRHFDRRFLHVGALLGTAVDSHSPTGLIGLYAEANVWDRLALGGSAGANFWGPVASGYLRFRPIVWGGEGRHLLNAFTVRAEYTVMRQGEDVFSFCDEECGTRFVARTAQLGAISAGFEHQLWSGWTFRYDFGFAHVLSATPWKCERGQLPAPCDSTGANPDMMVTSFGVSHAL